MAEQAVGVALSVKNRAGFKRDIEGAKRDVEGFGDAAASPKMERAGGALTKTLTPAAIAAGAAFKMAHGEWDAAADAIRAGTGLTGDALKSVEQSAKNVGSSATQGLGEIGAAIADVQTATGLMGADLEALTSRILGLREIGQDVDVGSITRMFGDWSVATENQAEALDRLNRTSQATGAPVDRLLDLIVKYGAPLRNFGFGMEEAAALLGKWEKEGVNTELVMGGLRAAQGKFAREGIPLRQGLKETIEAIQGLGRGTEATNLAMDVFGQRAGADLADTVLGGKFAVDELVASIAEGKETIPDTVAATRDWSDKLSLLKNRVVGVIGPIGEVGMGIAGVAAGVGPAILGISKLTQAIQSSTKATAILGIVQKGLPFLAIGAAIVGLAILIIKNWDTIKEWTGKIWTWIQDKVGDVARWISEKITRAGDIMFDAVGRAIHGVKSLFTGYVNFLIDKINWVIRQINRLPGVDLAEIGLLEGPGTFIGRADRRAADALASEGDRFAGGRAYGGPISAMRPYIVGERGVEVVTSRHDAQVTPLPGFGSTTINFHPGSVQIHGVQNPKEIWRMMKREIEDEVANY